MQIETSNTAFLPYGSVYQKMDDQLRAQLLRQSHTVSTQRYLSQFLHFSCDTYLEIQNGLGLLLVSTDPHTAPIEKFSMNYRVHIKPNIYFSIVSTTQEMVVDIYCDSTYSMDIVALAAPYEVRPVLPRIQVQEILGCFYRIRSPGYLFTGENHNFFELTYVDSGTMRTEVDGVLYELKEKELILYGPGQFHRQSTPADQPVSYLTILFDMGTPSADTPPDWYKPLLNRVFAYSPKIYSLMKTVVQESTTALPYMDSLVQCLVSELIVRLLQGEFNVSSAATPANLARQNYRDELFEKVIGYVESKLYEPLTIADICQQFSLSRSSLQLLFKNVVNQSPKKYISDMKLEKSCQLLRENKYTVSEVAVKLGYSSIHYFSNAFHQKYHVSPSEYAKRIY